jgi:hypothetical protein
VTPEVRLFQAFANQQLHSSWTEAMRGISVGIARCVLNSRHLPGREKGGVSVVFHLCGQVASWLVSYFLRRSQTRHRQ